MKIVHISFITLSPTLASSRTHFFQEDNPYKPSCEARKEHSSHYKYFRLKRVLVGTERGILIWDPRSSYNPEKPNEKPTVKVIGGFDSSIRSISVSTEFEENSESDFVFIGDDQGVVTLMELHPSDLTLRPVKVEEEKTFLSAVHRYCTELNLKIY